MFDRCFFQIITKIFIERFLAIHFLFINNQRMEPDNHGIFILSQKHTISIRKCLNYLNS